MTLISQRHHCGLGICVLALGAELAASIPSQSLLLEGAARYRAAGQLDRAIATYREALAVAPSSERAYLALAAIYIDAVREDEARLVLEAGLDHVPGSRPLHIELAELHFRAGRASEALTLFESAGRLDGDPDLDPALEIRVRSSIQQRIGDMHTYLIEFDDALAAYDRAIAIDPDNVEARLVMANVNLRRNRLARAASGYREVLDRDADSVPARYGLARTYLALGRFAESASAAQEVLQIEPDHVAAAYILARALIREGRRAEGEAALAAYREMEARARTETSRGRRIQTIAAAAVAELIRGEYQNALDILRAGIETVPDSHELYMDLGLAENHLGLYQDAIDTFLTAIDLGLDTDPLLHDGLADAYEAIGNLEEARRHRTIFAERLSMAVKSP